MTLAEAAMSGRTAVAFSIGGVPEIVRDGETGFLVPVGDFERLHDGLERLLSDARLATGLGDNARQHVAGLCGREAHCRQRTAIYREARARRGLTDGGKP